MLPVPLFLLDLDAPRAAELLPAKYLVSQTLVLCRVLNELKLNPKDKLLDDIRDHVVRSQHARLFKIADKSIIFYKWLVTYLDCLVTRLEQEPGPTLIPHYQVKLMYGPSPRHICGTVVPDDIVDYVESCRRAILPTTST